MENTQNYKHHKTLINELNHGKELVRELRVHLGPSSSSTGQLLLKKLLVSIDNSVSMLNLVKLEGETRLTGQAGVIGMGMESPCTMSGSLRSGYISDLKDKSKKRKILPKWTQKVRACPKTGLEGPLDDGYSWRKYGQKSIVGTKYHRGYFRCTYQNVHGCAAIKQVQRDDEDPSTFSVTYRGTHSCLQASHLNQGKSPNKQNQDQGKKKTKETFINFQAGFEVKSEDLHSKEFTSSSFSFTSTSPIKNTEQETTPMLTSLPPYDHFMGSCNSPIISSTTSESNCSSPDRVNSFGGQDLQPSNSDLHKIFSSENLASNSATLDFDLDLPMYFDSQFPFDTPGLFR